MSKFILFFITAFVLVGQASFSQEAPTRQTEIQNMPKAPDFSPPKDLTGPVFPMEDIIDKPPPDTSRFMAEFLNMLATLGLLISLILIVAWFLKRMVNSRQEQGNVTSIIKIIERRSLSPKSVIFLLEVEGKTLIVAESQNGVTKLSEYDTQDEGEEAKIPSSFGKILEKNE